jgi:hypothetical protein
VSKHLEKLGLGLIDGFGHLTAPLVVQYNLILLLRSIEFGARRRGCLLS